MTKKRTHTHADYLRKVMDLQAKTTTGCTNVLNSRLESVLYSLERLAAIDRVLMGNIVAHAYDPDLCPPEADVMAIRKLKQIHGEQVIDALIAQDLLPKAEVAADEAHD